MKSCTECIRVDKSCAYCTDEVSYCRQAFWASLSYHPAPLAPPLALANLTLAILSVSLAPGQSGV